MSERSGQSHRADAGTSVNTSMPSCRREHSGQEEGKLPISKYNLWKVFYFGGSNEANYVSANKYSKVKTIFGMYDTLEGAPRRSGVTDCYHGNMGFGSELALW